MKSNMLAVLAATTMFFVSPAAAQQGAADVPSTTASYLSNAGHDDAWAGGVRMVPIKTAKGNFNVWVKRGGNNPKLKLLLLHGGPAFTHDYLQAFESFMPVAGVEYYFYDQLGSGRSDKPEDDDLWTIPRFVSEVDQVRQAIGGTKDNFCLYGHSWGGILAMEYALAYQDQLKCLVISNMMASIPAYNAYAKNVLEPQMDPAKLKLVKDLEVAGKTDDPRFMETLIPEFYEKHLLRRPFDQWPEPVTYSMSQVNAHVYKLMQGPSEFGASGRLANWDQMDALKTITVPTLVISSTYDTMDPAYMARMAKQLPKGELLATGGSHLSMYDDQKTYFDGLTAFLAKFR